MVNARASQIPKVSHEPGSLEAAPALSLFAMDGWACSRVRFSLRKERNKREKRSAFEERRKTKATTSKKLTPQGEQLASRRPDRWASSHPASGLQTPRGRALAQARQFPPGGHRDWRSYDRPLLCRKPRRDHESVAPSPRT